MNGISQLANTNTPSTQKANNMGYLPSGQKDNLSLSMEDFLSLLVAQFQNQDIENPASTSDMLNQLIQMATIQSMTTMTDASTMTYAASLVGKEVTIGVMENGKLTEIVGTVTGTATYAGEQVIIVNDKTYSLTSIMAIGKLPPPKDDTEKPGDKPEDKPEDKPSDKPESETKKI